MINKHIRWGILAGLVAAGTAFAQNGTIQGIIVDAQSAAIPNAKVSVTDESKGIVVRETTTDMGGNFRLLQLLRG
ncbi:MAG: carboxypeptidase regulatory-like domain-containing protein, partial [Bryobacterales bacterium]|nr:carboxypeptidase regulatory-like domain-containing protein [Bryobacterales bacterium]